MRCDGAPDPAVQKEMNTYMSLWRDDPEVNITLVLQQCNLALQVCMCLLIKMRGKKKIKHRTKVALRAIKNRGNQS